MSVNVFIFKSVKKKKGEKEREKRKNIKKKKRRGRPFKSSILPDVAHKSETTYYTHTHIYSSSYLTPPLSSGFLFFSLSLCVIKII